MPTVVVVVRVEPGVDPPYEPYARATCGTCPEWVWLGSDSFRLVTEQDVIPICHECAAERITEQTPRVGHAEDEPRAGHEGP